MSRYVPARQGYAINKVFHGRADGKPCVYCPERIPPGPYVKVAVSDELDSGDYHGSCYDAARLVAKQRKEKVCQEDLEARPGSERDWQP